MKEIIKRLTRLPVYSSEHRTKKVDGRYTMVEEPIQIAERYPSYEEMMNKINEIIDYINGEGKF